MKLFQKLLGTLLLVSFLPPTQLFAAAGDLYVTSIDEETPANGEVIRISPNGTIHSFVGPVPDPYGILFDDMGQLLVASDPSNAIYRYALDGTRTTFATGM